MPSSSQGAEYFWSCRPEVYTSPDSKFDPESLVCESVRFVDPAELAFPSSLVLAAREMAIMHPRTCAVPELSSARVLVVSPSDDADEELLKNKKSIDNRLNLKRVPIGVNRDVLQSCLQFSIETRISPQWNRIGALFVRGRDFLFERVLDAVEARLRLDGQDGPVLSVKGGRVRTRPINLHDFIVPEHIKDDFAAKRISVVPQEYMGLMQVRVLPNLTWARVESLSHETVAGSGLKTWKSMRRYWKNMYGYRLGDKDVQEPNNFYVNVTFGSMSTIFSYPNQCVLETEPVPVPGVKALPIINQFVADINDKIRTVGGQPIHFEPRTTTVALEDIMYSLEKEYDRDKPTAQAKNNDDAKTLTVMLGSKTFAIVPGIETNTIEAPSRTPGQEQQQNVNGDDSTVSDQSSNGNHKVEVEPKNQAHQYIAIKTVPKKTAKKSGDQKDLQKSTATFIINKNIKSAKSLANNSGHSSKKQPKLKAAQSTKGSQNKKSGATRKAEFSGEKVKSYSKQNQQMSTSQVESLLQIAEDVVTLPTILPQGPPIALPLQPLEVNSKTANVASKKKIAKRKPASVEKKGNTDPNYEKSASKFKKRAVSVKSSPKVLSLQTLNRNASPQVPPLASFEDRNSDLVKVFEFESPSASPISELRQTSVPKVNKKDHIENEDNQERTLNDNKNSGTHEHVLAQGRNWEQLQTQFMACVDEVSHNDTTHLMTSFEDDEQVLPHKPKANKAKYTYSSQTLTSGMKKQRLEWSGDSSAFQTK